MMCSENTVDISKGQLDRTGTSKKVLVARATALGMNAWTAGASLCSVYPIARPCLNPFVQSPMSRHLP